MAYYLQTSPGVLVILVRHGATPLNDSGMVRGWEDVSLAPDGQAAIRSLAGTLKPFGPKYVISSDFMRDTETASILASYLNLPTETDYDARTWDIGEYSGKPEDEVNPAIHRLYRHHWETPDGSSESFDGFTKRWLNFLENKMQFAQIDGYRPTIIVTHGRNIAVSDSHFNHKMPEDGTMPFAGGYALISVTPDRAIHCDIQGESESVCEDV